MVDLLAFEDSLLRNDEAEPKGSGLIRFRSSAKGEVNDVTRSALSALSVLLPSLFVAGCGATRTVTKTVTVPASSTVTTAAAQAPTGETFERIPQVVQRVSPSIVTILVRTA